MPGNHVRTKDVLHETRFVRTICIATCAGFGVGGRSFVDARSPSNAKTPDLLDRYLRSGGGGFSAAFATCGRGPQRGDPRRHTTPAGGAEIDGWRCSRSSARCPKDVLCIVAGEATVVLVVMAGGEATKLTFKVPPGGSDEQRVEDYRVTILKLDPEVESGKVIEPSSYIAEIVVDEIS